MMKVKVIFGNDIRRWRYPESKRYQNLLEFIKQTFNFLDERQFYVQFEDDEGDRLTLTSETDFEDAFSCAEQEERKSLKIFVIKGSIEDSHNNSGASQVQPNDEKEESPVQPKTSNNNNESFFDEQNNCNNNCKNNCKNECNNNCKNNCNNKDNSNDQGCFFNCRPLVLDFLQNKEIQALLPQFVMRLLTALRKEQQQTSNQKNVLQIINEILGENQFKAITNHELYKQKIAFMLPCIAEKLQSHQHLLFLFNEDAISSWMPHLINILTTSFSNFENIDLEFDVDPIFNQFIPSFCHRNFNTESNNCSNKCEQNIHSDVCCDGCECCPIIGNRYKCSVCPNYDLCSKCETSGKHDPTHPLLKIPCPNGCLNQQYTGLHEFLRSSRHRRCHRGFNHGFHRRGRHFTPNLFRTCPFRNNFNANCFANGVPSNFCASRNECPNENKSNEMEPKSFEKSNVICECGELLNPITAGQAYNGSRAYCNVCNKPFDLSETIYHCPQKQNAVHRGGYDLCQNCVNIQIQSVISTSNKVNTNQQQNENNENNVKNVNEVKENKNDEDDFVPIAPLNVNEIENNNQGNAMSQKNSEPELVEMEDISDNEKGNEDDKFEFKSQLNSLQDMGFNDVEKLKFLLNKHKGDIQQVVQEFLQA